MRINQVNLRKSFVATNLFVANLDSNTIGLLTEPYHYKNKICKLGYNFDLFPDTTLKAPPRAAILVPKTLGASFLPQLSTPDVTVVYFRAQNLLLVSGYCDAKLPVVQGWLTKIMNYVNGRNCKVVFGLDSNAHSELYGHETDSRGEVLEEFIFMNSLEVENRGDIPTFSTLRRDTLATSFIDITLSKNVTVAGWHVDESFNNSDHNTLKYEIVIADAPTKMIRPWKRANWKRFRRIIANHTFYKPPDMTIKKIDTMLRALYTLLNRALDKACPMRPARAEESNLKWWNARLDRESKKLHKQHKIAKRCRSLTETIKLKIMKQKFKKLCKNQKRNSWRLFTSQLKENDKMASLARALQNKEKSKLYTLKKPDGTMTEPGKDTLDLLFRTHFPASTPLREPQPPLDEGRAPPATPSTFIDQKYGHWINEGLLFKAMEKFNKKKSPGPDGIKPVVFDHLPDNFIQQLLFIYKCCVYFHYTPILWKDTKVIFIPKPGKDDYTLPKSFRPISLSNYFLKAFERLVCWRMDFALSFNPIHDKQHGFMKGRSTESAISVTTNYIEKFLAHKQYCLAVFLDISAAFDSIDIDHVRRALLKHGGPTDMVGWYHNYLSHRNLYATLHQEDASCSTGVGFPQGGVCSARFWLIAFNQAIKIINNNYVEGVGYADDCCILMGGTDQIHMVTRVQRVVDKLITWGNTCGLRFNHSKTVVILFSKNNKTFSRHITIDGLEVPYSHRVKYLGLTLDSKLAWNTHIKEKALACKRFLFMVARIAKDAYGPSPKIMRWCYLCMVRPMMTYGALCWGHMVDTGNIDKILRNLNRAGMNTYSNFPRSSPTRTVEIITDTIPLSLQVQKIGISARIRLREVIQATWENPDPMPSIPCSHIKWWDQLIFDCNLENFMQEDDSVTLNMPFSKFTVCTDSFSGESKYQSLSQINIFTDGSKLNDKVGAGFTARKGRIPFKEMSFRLPDKCSVFQAEIFAINQAALFIQRLGYPRYIKIFVDSQAALLALNKKDITSRLVGDTVHNLNLIPGLTRLVWIKAHVGHEGNERADELAKAGTLLPHYAPVALPKQATKAAINSAIDEIWNFQWSQYNDGRQSKQFYSQPNRTKAKYCYNLNRQDLGRFIRLITGHNNLFYHRSNVDKTRSTSPLCRFCGEERETFYHFATNCPCFRLSRFQFFQSDTCFVNNKWSIQQLLDFSKIPSITAALGGNFDPLVHLEQQRDFEDLIEAEQDDADLQPDRQHDPQRPRHNISSDDSDDSFTNSTQYITGRALIQNVQRIHNISTSESSDDGVDPCDPDTRSTLGADAASRITVSSAAPGVRIHTASDLSISENSTPADHATSFARNRLNYDTLEITDDEYLENATDNDDSE